MPCSSWFLAIIASSDSHIRHPSGASSRHNRVLGRSGAGAMSRARVSDHKQPEHIHVAGCHSFTLYAYDCPSVCPPPSLTVGLSQAGLCVSPLGKSAPWPSPPAATPSPAAPPLAR